MTRSRVSGQASGFSAQDMTRLGIAEAQVADLTEQVAELTRKNEKIEGLVTDIHDALFKAAPDGGPSFFARASTALVAAERANWAAKWLVRALLTAGAMAGAGKVLFDVFRGGGAGQ